MIYNITAPAISLTASWWVVWTWSASYWVYQKQFNWYILNNVKCKSFWDNLTNTWITSYYYLYYSTPTNWIITTARSWMYWKFWDEIDYNNLNNPIDILSWATLFNYSSNIVRCELNITMPNEYISFLNYWNILCLLFILFVPLLMSISTIRKIKNKNLDLTKIKNLFSNIKKNEK